MGKRKKSTKTPDEFWDPTKKAAVVVDRHDKEPWHLSKSVPLSLIFAIVVQTVLLAGAWFSHVQEFQGFKDHTKLMMATLQGSTDDRYRKSQAASDLALRDERISRLALDIAGLEQSISNIDRSLDQKFEKLSDLIRNERGKKGEHQ